MSQATKTSKFLKALIFFFTFVWGLNLYFLLNPSGYNPVSTKNNSQEIWSLILQTIPLILLIYQTFKTKDKLGKIYWIFVSVILAFGSIWHIVSFRLPQLQHFPYSFISICTLLLLNILFYQIYLRKGFNIFK